jgi:PAS domain S-box-containing protein
MNPLLLRKLLATPVLVGLFFVCFVVAAGSLLFLPGPRHPLLVFAVAGMAVSGSTAIKGLMLRGRDTEQALQEGERYIEAVAELSQDIHAIIDTRTRSFLYMNSAVETVLGYPQENFLKGGLDYFNALVHPEDLPSLRKQYEQLLAPLSRPLGPSEVEHVQEQIFRIRNNHGDYRWFKSRRTAFVRFHDGHPAEFLAVVQDITEQRSYEAALVEAKKTESMGALARGTVHDLNNTLMGIQGFAEIARGAGQDSEALRSNLDNVQSGIQRASSLCRQMLAYTGQGRIQIAPRQLNDAVRESLPAIESLIPAGGHLVLELASDAPLVNVDLNQARYALLNLVYNSAEAVGNLGGEISIRTRRVRLDGNLPTAPGLAGEFVCLEVRDTGPGTPPEVHERLYDPLFTSLCPGHGLGLSAVQGIIREHQGAIHAVSRLGEGDSTSLYFPLAEKNPTIDEGDEGTPVAGGAGVILLVDDEPTIRAILRQGLEAAGFKVMEAVDGVEGLGSFVRHRSSISAVLLDLTMPRMGGDEVFSEIHKLAPDMPVVLMSGYSEQEATSAMSSKGLAGFLPKPCSIKDALTVLGKAMGDPGARADSGRG